jgi:hypothetical protein
VLVYTRSGPCPPGWTLGVGLSPTLPRGWGLRVPSLHVRFAPCRHQAASPATCALPKPRVRDYVRGPALSLLQATHALGIASSGHTRFENVGTLAH